MQRQSLGSPSTKNLLNETNKQPNSSSTTTSPITKNINTSLINGKKEEEEIKKLKPKPNTNTTTHKTYIHLIPMLTLLCFLILYLSSHNPSQNDLAQFNGFNHLHNNPSDLVENISGLMEIKKGDVLLKIRSLKSDRQSGTVKPQRLHRKIVVNS